MVVHIFFLKAATRTCAWVITGGTASGVMDIVGKAGFIWEKDFDTKDFWETWSSTAWWKVVEDSYCTFFCHPQNLCFGCLGKSPISLTTLLRWWVRQCRNMTSNARPGKSSTWDDEKKSPKKAQDITDLPYWTIKMGGGWVFPPVIRNFWEGTPTIPTHQQPITL